MPARLLTVAAIVISTCAVAVLVLPSRDPYRVTARFTNAGQLVPGNQVRMGAATVGSVERIRLAGDGVAAVRLRIDADLAPLRVGTIARIRMNSLAGVANRYISLEVPPSSPGQDTIASGGTLPTAATESAVDLDALLASFDAPTRAGLRSLIRGGATHLDGRVTEAQRGLELLEPALFGLTGFARELARDEAAFDALLRDGAAAAGALASRRSELSDLVTQAGTTASAVAAESEALRTGLEQLPGTLRASRTTFAGLRETFGDLDPLVAASLRGTRDLAPFATELGTLAGEARTPVSQLASIVARNGAANDLTDIARAAPELAELAETAFPRAIRTLDRSTGQIETLRNYTPDLVATAARAGQIAAGYDANGHYARVSPAFFGLRYDADTGRLEADDRDRLGRLQGAADARCPGGVISALADLSAPLEQSGCRLSSTPPGP